MASGIKQFFWPTSDLPGTASAPLIYPSKLIVATLLAFSVIVALTVFLVAASNAIETEPVGFLQSTVSD